MSPLRRSVAGFWLALALLVGQQAAALHALVHAAERITVHTDGVPAPHSSGECFLSAQLCGGSAVSVPTVTADALSGPAPSTAQPVSAALAPRRAFLSRAPPVLHA